MMETQHPRHRRGLGPARDEPPSQNRVHGWGSACCVMRSCSARGHGNQRDRELSRIWTCKSRRCRPPQTGEPATRENIAASRRTTVTTTATRLRCCHPQYLSLYPSGFLQPCPFRFGDRDPIGGDPPTHPLDLGPGSRAASLVSEVPVHNALSIFSSPRHEPDVENSQRCRGPWSSLL